MSGNLLLKVIVRESHLDTNATTGTIRTKLSSLDEYIVTIGSDITKFNGYVRLLVDSLAARGETTQDLLTNLFKGYLAATDKVFVKYIRRKLENYQEGTNTQPGDLMLQASNKYKLLKEAGTWNAPSEEEEKILALQAEMHNLKKDTKRSKSEPKKGKTKTVKKTAKVTKHKKDGEKKRGSGKPDWFTKEPAKDKLNTPKMWKNQKWYYCHKKTGGQCDGIFRQHKPSECQGRSFRFETPRSSDKTTKDDGKRKIKLAKAMEVIEEEESNSETESDSDATASTEDDG